MGRRKERRLAAMNAAGRRVKLDLSAEPSGDLGDSTVQEGVGWDGDSRTHTELPSSPHSSGRQPQNPLVLLEQYSDEESEDGTEGQNNPVSQGTSISTDKEAVVAASEDTDHIENSDGKEHHTKVEEVLRNDGSAVQDPSGKLEEVNVSGVNSDELQQAQSNEVEEPTHTAASDECLTGDVSSGWKMVLHEESNRCYYWNILTGETSWEVPDVFAEETVKSVERANGDVRGKMDASMEQEKSNTPLYMEEDYISREVGFESNVTCQNCEGAVQGTTLDYHERFKGDAVDGGEGNKEAKEIDDNSLLDRRHVENRSGTELPFQLIKQYESLLERLNSVKGLSCHTEEKDLKLRCVLEVEIRLADIKALASHGSSLRTFWVHSENQLKRLETAVEDAFNRPSASPRGFDSEVDSSIQKERTVLEPQAATISKSLHFETHDVVTTMGHLTSLCHSSTYPVNDVVGKSEITAPHRPTHSGEDEDMDVEMELDDASTVKSPHGYATGVHQHQVSPDLSGLHNNPVVQESSVPGNVLSAPPVGDWIPPPPPDNEPFPPPPPDDEPFPPPPPDEPPETSYPPYSHLVSIQPLPYPEQYALSYPGSGLEYYGQTNHDVSANTLYTHPVGGHVTLSHLPHYYDAVPNAYGVTPLAVSAIDSTAYYGTPNASLSHVPLISGASGASIARIEPAPEHFDSTSQVPLDSLAQAGSSLLAKPSLNVGDLNNGSVKASAEDLDAQHTAGAPAVSMANGVSITSTSDTTSSASAAASTKAQSKVVRNKKRTVATVSSLRSNKKVSTLVDKWKAAKEELQEEEEEPENAYEVLERKRQREIEQWRAQQIASGEAKDNANFQPLGGDWRERVKRRRAERMKEKKQSSPDVPPPDGNLQQVDLVELSKGLPSGWQAYWDDSSKQVYYGNVLTSETTWTRPAD